MPEQTFSATFWGVRGGYPKPGPTTNKFGGNTTCLEVRAGYHLIIVDAGTGIISLGEKLTAQHQADKKPIVATILFTHTHHDHTQGFPFFTPSRLGSSVLHIFGPKLLHQDLEAVLAHAMLPPVFPVEPDKLRSLRVIRNVSESEMIVLGEPDAPPQVCNVYREYKECSPGEVRMRVMHSYAHPQGIFVYRIEMDGKKLIFATDVEGYAGGDRRLIQFDQGADLLIHDAELLRRSTLTGTLPGRAGVTAHGRWQSRWPKPPGPKSWPSPITMPSTTTHFWKTLNNGPKHSFLRPL